jgi:creatinine amidohydrolase
LLESLTSPQVARLAAEGRVVGLIGTGAVEQHGPHLPLGTDAIIARHLAVEIADRLEATVLVAPVLPGGLSSHHLGFPGTVDLPAAVLMDYTRAYVATMHELGVPDVALFAAHGGNFGAIAELAREYTDGPRVIAYSDMGRYVEVMMGAAASAGVQVPATDIHAGGLETSQMLFLEGDAVTVPPGLEGYVEAEPGWLERLMGEGVAAVSANGVLGRPSVATAEAGAAICAALADEIAAWMTSELDLTAEVQAARS